MDISECAPIGRSGSRVISAAGQSGVFPRSLLKDGIRQETLCREGDSILILVAAVCKGTWASSQFCCQVHTCSRRCRPGEHHVCTACAAVTAGWWRHIVALRHQLAMLHEHAACDCGREHRKARASRAWHAPPHCRSVPAAAVERAAVAQGARLTLAQLS